ncbi:isochorismatase family protein [Muribaculum intestinale]|mgnify:FL=1|uniref:isochorismatase family protein n=1 Tax=Muribaculum intestinale TaxID=1796646 RepID=UPI000F488236|nr:isochorismatase family protein [Muribaculum intestinale]ROT04109.1 isochorismatase family protein [Muribaculaceae bacterium Isolate-100 (HZI)]RXE64196.1 isochorismatase family protein [Muribaculaceae bacterium Isolate-007 (NCI)]
MKNKLLLVIDPQIDFITGSLPVPGAESAMNALAGYIRANNADYACIIVTADYHPMCHCSFNTNGGEWPRHCVADSVGAAIWPPIMTGLLETPDKVFILHKGEDAMREEYSVFRNSAAAGKILHIIESYGIGIIDICGLAGDICVSDTIRDGVGLIKNSRINVLVGFSPSIDGGDTLRSIISEYGLSCDRQPIKSSN